MFFRGFLGRVARRRMLAPRPPLPQVCHRSLAARRISASIPAGRTPRRAGSWTSATSWRGRAIPECGAASSRFPATGSPPRVAGRKLGAHPRRGAVRRESACPAPVHEGVLRLRFIASWWQRLPSEAPCGVSGRIRGSTWMPSLFIFKPLSGSAAQLRHPHVAVSGSTARSVHRQA